MFVSVMVRLQFNSILVVADFDGNDTPTRMPIYNPFHEP